jgi:hypothetical protein
MKHSPAARKGMILAVEQLLYSKVAKVANIANICSHPVGNLGAHFGNLEKVMSSRSVEFGGQGQRGQLVRLGGAAVHFGPLRLSEMHPTTEPV